MLWCNTPDACRSHGDDSEDMLVSDDISEEGSYNSEDDPNRLWCICKRPHNNRYKYTDHRMLNALLLSHNILFIFFHNNNFDLIFNLHQREYIKCLSSTSLGCFRYWICIPTEQDRIHVSNMLKFPLIEVKSIPDADIFLWCCSGPISIAIASGLVRRFSSCCLLNVSRSLQSLVLM